MNRKQRWLVGVGILAIVCLWLLSGSVSTLSFKDGFFFYSTPEETAAEGGAFSSPGTPAPDWVKMALFVVVWVLFPLSLIVALFNPQMLKSALMRALTLSLWLLALIALTRVLNRLGDWFGAQGGSQESQNPWTGDAGSFPPADEVVLPWWTQGFASLLVVCLGAWLLWRARRQWLISRRRLSTELELQLAAEAGQAAADLRAGAPLREVVLRCYQAMCQLLAKRQTRTSEYLTPREFEAELAHAGIDDPAIAALSRLFERVRYGAQSAVSEDEVAALSSLECIKRRYGGAA